MHVRPLIPAFVVFSLTASACVGGSPGGGGDASSSSSSGGTGESSSGSSGATSSSASSSGTTPDGGSSSGGSSSSSGESSSSGGASSSSGGSSSGGELDAGVTCVEHAFRPTDANARCAANRSSAQGGGIIQPGVYVYSRRWGCDANTAYVFGSATVLDDGGTLRMRYRYRHNPDVDDNPGVGPETVGTWTLAPDTVNGTLRRTEECRVPNVGAFEDATAYKYDVATGALTLRFAGFDEQWTRVP